MATTNTPTIINDVTLNDVDYLAPVPDILLSNIDSSVIDGGVNPQFDVITLSRKLQEETGFHIPPSSLKRYTNFKTLQTHLKLKIILKYFKDTRTPIFRMPLSSPHSLNDRPLIFLHAGVIGWPLPYIKLVKSLNRSSIIIQRCEAAPMTSFESMARYYVNAILEAQPEGPYSLVGVCYGAMLLYEVARQLTKLERNVKTIVQQILSSPDSAWIPFTSAELESVYLGFFAVHGETTSHAPVQPSVTAFSSVTDPILCLIVMTII